MLSRALSFFLCLFTFSHAQAEENLKFGAFVDGYFAYDSARPDQRDRAFTTQPARHDEFNINLAYVEMEYENSDELKGRLALQVGTSVEANYSTEPTQGNFSNGDMAQFLQEAYLGTKIAEDTWLYGGIFFSHIGLESFISSENMTYTRSMVSDFSPYYQTGVKIHHDFTDELSLEFHVLNGWQVVTESNDQKAFGIQVAYATESFTFAYNNLVGGEANFRHFHDFVLTTKLKPDWEMALQADIGFQEKRGVTGESDWYGVSVISKVMTNERTGFSQRLEFFNDNDQVIVATGQPGGFDMVSFSFGFDRELSSGVLWRSEIRHFQSTEKIIPKEGSNLANNNQLFVTSLSYNF